eukprot:XP_765520.1 hypothetical protein [Theileria parva strain Muguga]
MNLCVCYTYVLIHIIIQYASCSDKPSKIEPNVTVDSDDSDEEENFQVIVRGIENILEEDGEKTAGQTVVSDNVMEHGLGPVTDQVYIPPTPHDPGLTYQPEYPTGYEESGYDTGQYYQPEYPTGYQQDEYVETGYDEGAVGYYPGYEHEYYLEGYEEEYHSENEKQEVTYQLDKKEEIVEDIKVGLGYIHPDLSSTKFIGLDSSGSFIEMDSRHYRIDRNNIFRVTFVFKIPIVELFCEGTTVCEIKLSEQPKNLIYSKINKAFFFYYKEVAKSYKFKRGIWYRIIHIYPKFVKFYSIDQTKNLLEITENQYILLVNTKKDFMYFFNPKVKCFVVKVNDEIVWSYHLNAIFPRYVIVNSKNKLVINFYFYCIVYRFLNGLWTVVYVGTY